MANPFDYDTYFSNKAAEANDPLVQKLDGIVATHDKKLEELEDTSWVKKYNLDPNSVAGNVVDTAASLVSGASRVAGHLRQLPNSVTASIYNANVDNSHISAYNRFQGGKATPQDINLLNTRPSPNLQTPLENIKASQANRAAAQEINEYHNVRNIVDQSGREAFTKEIGEGFEKNYSEATEGVDEIKEGEFIAGLSKLTSGVGKLIANAGSAVLNNKATAVEYIVENIPQLALGVFGKAGTIALVSSNAGYAIEQYQMGLEAYKKKHNGQLPSVEKQEEMAGNALMLAVVEHGSDVVSLGMTKLAGKAVTKAAGDAANRTSIPKAVKETAKGGTVGLITEAPTEAYQTYIEGKIVDEPATPKDIFTSGVIGGVAGLGLAGSGRALHEGAKLSAQKARFKDDPIEKGLAERSAAAIESGDINSMVDPANKKTYAPDEAIRALHGNAKREDTTEETKQEHLKTADDAIEALVKKETALEGILESTETLQGIVNKASLQVQELESAESPDLSRITELKTIVDAYQSEIDRRKDKGELSKAERKAYEKELAEKKAILVRARKEKVELDEYVIPNKVMDKLIDKAAGTDTLTPEMSAAIDFIKSFDDAGGAVMSTAPMKRVAEALGLTLDSKEKPEALAERIREKIVGSANTKEVAATPSDNTEATRAANIVITHAMKNTDRVPTEKLKKIANNKGNGLTKSQRDFLRKVAKARELKKFSEGLVLTSKDIFEGNQGNKGLLQHTQVFNKAIKANKANEAANEIDALKKFATAHSDKAWALSNIHAALKPNEEVQAVLDANKGWSVNKGETLSPAELKKRNGLIIRKTSFKLIDAIKSEARALKAALTAMESQYNLVFSNIPLDDLKGGGDDDDQASVVKTKETEQVKAEVKKSTAKQRAESKKVITSDDTMNEAIIKMGGISTTLKLDITGDTKGNQGIPFIGSLFKEDGKFTDLSDLATQLEQYGYFTQAELEDVDGGAQLLRDRIREEYDGGEAHKISSEIEDEAEAAMQERAEQDQEKSEQVKEEDFNIWSGSGENAILSNLANRPFTYGGIKYKSVEHAYQTVKSGKFDQQTYDYKGWGKNNKLRGRLSENRDKNLDIMDTLIRTSLASGEPEAVEALALLKESGNKTITHKGPYGSDIWTTEFPRILDKIRTQERAENPEQIDNKDIIIFPNGLNIIKGFTPISELEKFYKSGAIQQLIKSNKLETQKARDTAWFGPVPYSYSNGTYEHVQKDMPPVLIKIAETLEQELGHKPGYLNSGLMNVIPAGNKIGKHADAESIFLRDDETIGSVVTVSFGGEAKITITRNGGKRESMSFTAESGDIYTMPDGKFQQEYLHAVGPAETERVSLTFRHIPRSVIKKAEQTEAALPVEEIKGLNALNRESKPAITGEDGTESQLREIIAEDFLQTDGIGTDGKTNPLITVKDLYTAYEKKEIEIADFLDSEGLTEKQDQAIKEFFSTSAKWFDNIQENLPKFVPDNLRQNDVMQYFVDTVGEVRDTEENVKLAISLAVIKYIGDHASDNFSLSDERINQILGRDRDIPVSKTARKELGTSGVSRSILLDSLGTTVMQALGLKAKNTTGQHWEARLRATLGQHALKLAEDSGLIVATSITNKSMTTLVQEGLDSKQIEELSKRKSGQPTVAPTTSGEVEVHKRTDVSDDKAAHIFYAITRGVKTKKKYTQQLPSPQAEKIREITSGSEGILNKLFGVEGGNKTPTLSPTKSINTKIKSGVRTITSLIPEVLIDVINKKVETKHNLNVPVVRVLESLIGSNKDIWDNNPILFRVLGAPTITPQNTHVINRPGAEAGNTARILEYDNIVRFANELLIPSKEGLDTPFYYDHTVWKQHRVGIAQADFNPVNSKISRYLSAATSWKETITIGDNPAMTRFALTIAEDLGIRIEERQFDSIWSEVQKRISNQELPYFAAIDAITELLTDGVILTPDQQNDIAVAVEAGGQNVQSLNALVNLASYKAAKDRKAKTGNKNQTFDAQMVSVTDGVANGTMINHILYGAFNNVKDLAKFVIKGGIFSKGDSYANYPAWRSKHGNKDIYEATGAKLKDVLADDTYMDSFRDESYPIIASIEVIAKPLFAGDMRKLIKGVFNPLMFSSSMFRIQEKLGDDFISQYYKGLERISVKYNSYGTNKTKAQRNEHKEELDIYIESVNWLLEKGGAELLNTELSIQTLMETELTDDQVLKLKAEFKEYISAPLIKILREDFAVFIDRQDKINKAAQMASGLYIVIYESERKVEIERLMEKGEIAKTKSGNPASDMNAKQEAAFAKSLKERGIEPIVHTAMSKAEDNLESGLFLGKSFRSTAEYGNSAYTARVRHNRKTVGGANSASVRGFRSYLESVGISTPAWLTHSLDSQTSHLTQLEYDILNIHDGLGGSLSNHDGIVKLVNENFAKSVLAYSPGEELANTLERVVQGVSTMTKAGELSPDTLQALTIFLTNTAEKINRDNKWNSDYIKTSGREVLGQTISGIVESTFKANELKFQLLQNLENVGQYASHTSSFEVPQEFRKKANTKLLELYKAGNKVDSNVSKAEKSIIGELDFGEEQVTETEFGKLGTSNTESNTALVDFFERNKKTTAKKVFQILENTYGKDTGVTNSDFYLKLLTKLKLALPDDLPITYITADTKKEDIRGVPEDLEVRGWTYRDGQKVGVAILGTEFKNSGITHELLVHELMHAALSGFIAKKTNNPHIVALGKLRIQAIEYIEANRKEFSEKELRGFNAATSNLDEFISWGMSNTQFQQKVLIKLTPPENKQESWLSTLRDGLQEFIFEIASAFFGSWTRTDSTAVTGMHELIVHVSGLMEQVIESRDAKDTGDTSGGLTILPMISGTTIDADIEAYTTLDIFNAFPDDGRGAPEFKDHLRELLEGIVDKLHGPFGSFKEALRKDAASNPLEVWLKALDDGKAPFASEILGSGFTGNKQQGFVIQQVEATMRAALDSNMHTVTNESLRTELKRLFKETKDRLTPEDFRGKFGANTLEDATELYDFVFSAKAREDGKSDYLARFAALSLAHEEFNSLLKIPTEARNPDAVSLDFLDRLIALYKSVLDFFHRKLANIEKGQNIDERLTTLVEQLVAVEAQRRYELKLEAKGPNPIIESAEELARAVTEKATEKVIKAAKSPIVRKSGSGIIRGTAALVDTLASGRLEGVLQVLIDKKNSYQDGQLKLGEGIINAIKNPLEAYELLVRGRKRLEGEVVQEIASVGETLRDAFEDKNLPAETKDAITAVLLRSGVHNLAAAGFTLSDIENLIGNTTAIKAEIKKLEDTLDQFGALKAEFIENANALGFSRIGGETKVQEFKHNAYQITRRFGVNRNVDPLNESQLKRADKTIKSLITLYALFYLEGGDTTRKQSAEIKKLMQTENARSVEEGNGIELALGLHKALEDQALIEEFDGNPVKMVHGYVPEIYNYRIKVETATEAEGKELINQRYVKSSLPVPIDPGDPNQEPKYLYTLLDGGMPPYLTSAVGFGSLKSKGTSVYDNYMLPNTVAGQSNLAIHNHIMKHRNRNRIKPSANFNPTKVKENYAAPIYSDKGDIVGMRYLMTTRTRNTLLERDNNYESVLGELAGSIMGKKSTIEQNKVAIKIMREQYELEYITRGKSYLLVGEDSSDPELKAIWDRLPTQTKKDVKEIWDRNGVMIRRDSVDILFGYPKVGMGDMFRRANDERMIRKAKNLPTNLQDLEEITKVEKLVIAVIEGMLRTNHRLRGHTEDEAKDYAKGAAYLVSRGENMWQGVVTEVKDIIVVKSGIVLLGNMTSNISMLYLQGVPMADAVKYTIVAYNSATQHKKDLNELNSLRISLTANYTKGNQNRITQRMTELEDSIKRNPVTPLINAGLMPTIVEDLDMTEDKYSFKSVLTKKVEKQLDKLPDGMVKVLRAAYMTRDSKMYQGLAHLTQMSDFTSRYALYQHQTTRTKNRLSHEEAIRHASRSFVNYDIPLHRWLQYSDDMGLTLFTKYFLYIQSELLRVVKGNPGRALSLLMMQNYLDILPPHIIESSMFAHAGNIPLGSGIFRYPDAVQTIPAMAGALAILK